MRFDPKEEVSVQPPEHRLHDFVFVGLGLKCVGSPTLRSAWFAQITLNTTVSSGDAILGQTTGFLFSDIVGHSEVHESWVKLVALKKYERGYDEFLLRYLREGPGIRLEFCVHEDRVRTFLLSLGNVKLQGRFPEENTILQTFFGGIETISD